MGTEQFTKIVPVNGMAAGVVHQHALVGEPVSGIGVANAPGPGNDHIKPAGLFSTAPYVDPSIARKAKLLEQQERKNHCKAKHNTCKGWAGPDGLCPGHRNAQAKGKDIGI